MNSKKNAVMTAVFLASILLVLTVADFVAKPFIPAEEMGRRSGGKAVLSLESWLDGSFMEAYETEIEEQFVSRDNWRDWKRKINVLLQRKEINGVYLCADSYLIEGHSPRQVDPVQVDEKLEMLNKLVETYDAKVMLVPTADNVLAQKLPLWAECYDQTELLAAAEEKIGQENLIDVYSVLKDHADEEIFYRTDGHWTMLGAYYGYRAWKEATDSVAMKVWRTDEMTTVTQSFIGSAGHRLEVGVKEEPIRVFTQTLEMTPKVTYDFKTVSDCFYTDGYLDTQNKYAYFLDGDHGFVQIETGYAGRGKLVVIKDSFANSMIPFLAAHYSTIYVVDPVFFYRSLDDFVGDLMTGDSQMLVLYSCVGFMEEFRYE